MANAVIGGKFNFLYARLTGKYYLVVKDAILPQFNFCPYCGNPVDISTKEYEPDVTT